MVMDRKKECWPGLTVNVSREKFRDREKGLGVHITNADRLFQGQGQTPGKGDAKTTALGRKGNSYVGSGDPDKERPSLGGLLERREEEKS